MAKAIMVQGTTSNAGKSLLTAALCRIFKQDGWRVAPFKSQNMALNSFITSEGLEMGRAQVMQAQAAGIEPSVRMNPILLKPCSDTGSQLIVNGEVRGTYRASEYYQMKRDLIPEIMNTYNALAAEYDIIVIEGAGSPAEINLKENDIVNMGMAKMARAPVLLAGDIDRGGVFASLAGTLMLLDEDEKQIVKGLFINKFRGDRAILKPGLDMIEEITKKPVVGVIPYLNVDIDDEDSLSDRLTSGGAAQQVIDIAVIRLPRISNFTDFGPLSAIGGVGVRYVDSVRTLGSPDLIIIPGTKSTIADLLWMRQNGLEVAVMKHAALGGAVIGVCGGYQMLGRSLRDPLGTEGGGEAAGLGLLETDTVFAPQKTRTQVSGHVAALPGMFAGLCGAPVQGYEIHMGQTDTKTPFLEFERENGAPASRLDGAVRGNVIGTYLHGLFDSPDFTRALVKCLCDAKGIDFGTIHAVDPAVYREQQYDLLAAGVRENIDMKQIYQILEAGI